MHVQFVNVNEMFSRHRDQIDAMVDLFTTAGVTLLMPGLVFSRNLQSVGFTLPDPGEIQEKFILTQYMTSPSNW